MDDFNFKEWISDEWTEQHLIMRLNRANTILDIITCYYGYDASNIKKYVSNFHNTVISNIASTSSLVFDLFDENGNFIQKIVNLSNEKKSEYEKVKKFLIRKGWRRVDALPVIIQNQCNSM